MKVAIFVHSLNGIGGIAKHTLRLSREFAAMGHEVAVWAMEYDRLKCYPDLAQDLIINAVRPQSNLAAGETRKPIGIRYLANVWALGRTYLDQHQLASFIPAGYDVINAHGNTISWAAAEHRRHHGIPVVWMCNDFWPLASHQNSVDSSIGRKFIEVLKRSLSFPFARYDQTAVRELDRIVVLSKQVDCQMREYYDVDPVVIRKGVDDLKFTQGYGEKIRQRYRIRDDAYLVLTVSSLMPRRRLEDAIRAIRILVDEGFDVTYLVVGSKSHTPEYALYVQDEIAALNLNDRIILADEVSETELVDCYAACNTFVWASDERQSWGSAAMEAMSAGKPVIVSNANGFAEILENGETALLVAPRSPEAIADAIRILMKNPRSAASLAEAGQRLMLDKYSWRAYAKTMLGLFQQAIDNA